MMLADMGAEAIKVDPSTATSRGACSAPGAGFYDVQP
jgi:crotonobetainyl-CoA:carnitine CoA-transferase CaiB-like acyl-CoA transferase